VYFCTENKLQSYFFSLEDFISTENLIPPLDHNNYIILALDPSLSVRRLRCSKA